MNGGGKASGTTEVHGPRYVDVFIFYCTRKSITRFLLDCVNQTLLLVDAMQSIAFHWSKQHISWVKITQIVGWKSKRSQLHSSIQTDNYI
jgi:hypothetical protein